MIWSDFDILQFYIVENAKQCIDFNTGHFTNVSFQKVGSNSGVFKEVSEKSPNKFHGIYGSKDVARHF